MRIIIKNRVIILAYNQKMNCNVRIIIKIRTNIYAHNQAMFLFHQYMLVGGMPMPVVAFI